MKKSYVKSFKLFEDELKYYTETKKNYEKILGFKLAEKQFLMILLAEINHSMNYGRKSSEQTERLSGD